MNIDMAINMFSLSKSTGVNGANNLLMLLPYRSEIYVKSIHGTMVVWLQNNGGYQRWGPTEARVDALLEAFRPARDKERNKALSVPPPQPEATIDPALETKPALTAVV